MPNYLKELIPTKRVRLQLHSWKVTIPGFGPNGGDLTLEAEPPTQFLETLDHLGLSLTPKSGKGNQC